MNGASVTERTATALRIASDRWFGDIHTATCGFDIVPMIRGPARLSCYILANGLEVVSRCSVLRLIGFQSAGERSAHELGRLLGVLARHGIDCETLPARVHSPVLFRPERGRSLKHGYSAETLEEICYAIIWGHTRALLTDGEARLAARCDLIVRSFEPHGMSALIHRSRPEHCV